LQRLRSRGDTGCLLREGRRAGYGNSRSKDQALIQRIKPIRHLGSPEVLFSLLALSRQAVAFGNATEGQRSLGGEDSVSHDEWKKYVKNDACEVTRFARAGTSSQ
jgi:hypothetical protein